MRLILRQAEDDRVLLRDRAAGERSAGAARHDVDPGVAAELHHPRDLFARARQDHGERQAAIGGERVGLERAPSGDVGDQAVGGQDRGQAGKDLVAPGEDGLVDRRESDLRHGEAPRLSRQYAGAARLGEGAPRSFTARKRRE